MGIWQAVVLDFSPNAFEGNVAKGYPGFITDQFAKLEEVLICPGIAVAPAGLLFEHFLNLPDQAFVCLHCEWNEGNVKLTGFACLTGFVPTCTNVYNGWIAGSVGFAQFYNNLL
jgi:hypothetical protein